MTFSVNIEIDHTGYIRGSGKMPPPIDSDENILSLCLNLFVESVNGVRELYLKLISDDGRLVGQERYELTQVLDNALTYLIALRHSLEGDNSFTMFALKQEFEMQINVKSRHWEGQGRLGPNRQLKNRDFWHWLKRIHERLLSLVKFLQDAQLDGVIDASESMIITQALDRMIFNVIIVRDGIESGVVQ